MVTFDATVSKILRRLSFLKRKSKSSYMCHRGEKVQLQIVLKQQVQTAIVTGEHIAICWLRDLSFMDKREKKGEK